MKAKIALMLLLLPALTSACASYPAAHPASRAGPLATGEHEATLRGIRLWYRVAGTIQPDRAPVVYLSGGPGGNSYSFARFAGPSLEPRNLMVYFDQRGTGRSERPASGDYALATLVDDIEALRVHLGVPRIALLAHSFGAVLALEYAAKYPARVEAAVLAGPLWNAPLSCREQAQHMREIRPEVHARMMADGDPSDDDICQTVFQALPPAEREKFNEENMFPDSATLAHFEASERESGLQNTGELSQAVFRGGLLQYRFAGTAQVTAPVLVVAGARDFAAGPGTQHALARALPTARIIEYPGLGHWMFIDDPWRFGRDVSEFLAKAGE